MLYTFEMLMIYLELMTAQNKNAENLLRFYYLFLIINKINSTTATITAQISNVISPI
jgi:hypothetical protein